MSDGLVTLVLLASSALVATWTLTYGWSWIARERFLNDMAILADDIEDEVFAGTLPNSECVQFQWAKARDVARYARMVSFSTALATEVSAPQLFRKSRSQTYAGLTPAQRSRMHKYEKRFVESIEHYLVHGSRLWFVLLIVPRILKALHRPAATPPRKLAQDLSRAMDKSKVHTKKGPRVSFDMIPGRTTSLSSVPVDA